MTRKLVVPFFAIALGVLMIGTPIFAHHGTAGVYDFTHRITTKATVTEYIWANPHVQIYFKLKNDKGEEETWGVETEVRETCSLMAGRRRRSSRETSSW
jgi:hypothetical protein